MTAGGRTTCATTNCAAASRRFVTPMTARSTSMMTRNLMTPTAAIGAISTFELTWLGRCRSVRRLASSAGLLASALVFLKNEVWLGRASQSLADCSSGCCFCLSVLSWPAVMALFSSLNFSFSLVRLSLSISGFRDGSSPSEWPWGSPWPVGRRSKVLLWKLVYLTGLLR